MGKNGRGRREQLLNGLRLGSVGTKMSWAGAGTMEAVETEKLFVCMVIIPSLRTRRPLCMYL
jgi:hypothetical protein